MQLQIWEKRCKWHSSHHLVFVYSGYNIATNVHCCFGKHSKLADKLRPPPLAGSGGQVGAFHIFQSNVLNLKKAMTHWSVCVCVCVCVLQWICCSLLTLSDLHLCVSVCLHLVEEAACEHMGRWGMWYLWPLLLLSHSSTSIFFTLYKWVSLSPCRLVCGITRGVGLVHETGHSQYTHDVFWGVDLWDWRILCRWTIYFTVFIRSSLLQTFI